MARALLALTAALSISSIAFSPTSAEPLTRVLSEQELVDMVTGSAILCTRGVDPTASIRRLRSALAQGKRFKVVALEDVPDDWMVFTAFGVGGAGAWDHVLKRMAQQERQAATPQLSAALAAAALAEHLGKTFHATFEAEAGTATANALLTAEQMDIPIIDGCPSGRCLPEVQMSPFFLNGIQRAPLAVVTRYGDRILIPHTGDDYRAEDLTRALAVASGGSVTVAANAVTGKVLKANLIPGFLSRATRLGRAAREAVANGRDPVAAVLAEGEGFLLFRGVVRSSETKGDQGFGWTDARLEGTGAYAGSQYRIYNKNENMIAWRDGRLDAAAPDLISALDPATGHAMRGGRVIGSFVVGEELAIVGFAAHQIWRVPKAIEMLGPKHFGFDEAYQPIEALHPERKR